MSKKKKKIDEIELLSVCFFQLTEEIKVAETIEIYFVKSFNWKGNVSIENPELTDRHLKKIENGNI